MPNYTFQCQDCFAKTEIKASIKDMEKGDFICDKCGSHHIKRIFDGFGLCKGNNLSTNTSDCASCRSKNCSSCNH